MTRSRSTTLALLILATAAGCATNPATGQRQLMLVSEGQEIQMGKQADQDVVASLGLYDDPELTRYVERLGQRLAKGSERPDLPWTFRIVDDPVVNAFALPGGYIYVTRGILAHLGSEAELVSVLGHEIGHVTARHGASRMSKAQLATLGLGVSVAVRPELADYADLASTGLGLLFLKYSRDDERQADDLGYRYLVANRYAPRPMAEVFTTLERVSQQAGAGRIPDWLATHPNPAERRQRVLDRIAADPGAGGDVVARDEYLSRIDGIVFGDDPRQGYFDDADFLHPGMRFQIRLPRGWKYQNGRDAVTAMSPQQDAVVRLTLARASSPDEAAQALAAQQGVAHYGSRRTRVDGRPAVIVDFGAQSESGPLRGRALYVAHLGKVFEIVGLARDGAFRGYDRTFDDSLTSFRELTDRRALNAKPDRLRVVKLRQAGTVEELARRYRSTADAATLALLNGVDPGAGIPRDRLFKYVEGGR